MTRVRLAAWLLSACMLALACNLPARAETAIDQKTTYFNIAGRTAEELDRELERRGPHTSNTGARHPGATRIKFGGDVTYSQAGGRCSIQTARVELSIRIILPRWTNRRKAPGDLGLLWDTIARDIKRHEERHAEIARQHARALDQALKALGSRASCAQLQAEVDEVSREALDAHAEDQARFDRIEAINFDRRMVRLLKGRLGQE